jgi:signal transduction histidine kinase
MKTLSLITRYLRRLFSYYIAGKKACLTDMIRLEEEVYHDFGSFYNKQLGLPVKRYKAGVRDKNIENDIRDGASLIIKRLAEIRDDLFSYCYPDTTLISIYRNVYKLESILSSASIAEIIDCLDKILAIGDNFYARHFKIARFDLDKLLEQIIASFQKSQNDKVTLKPILAKTRYQLRLPYADYANWLRIFRNIIINAIEAVELSGKFGRVEVQLSYPNKTSARIEIADNGVGMDSATLTNFTRRGFTSGKQSGQGLGVNEDTVLFLEKNGSFNATSVPGEGTTITIDIDYTKNTNGQLGAQLVSPQ